MDRKLPFEGIKVIDFCWNAAGPITFRYFSDYGATVVHVESHTHPETSRLIKPFKGGITSIDNAAVFALMNTGKYGISLNINTPKGQELAWRLIMWADIMGESFSPGFIKKWGMDYDSVKKRRPDIIYFSTSQQGQYGPNQGYRGYGPLLSAVAGFCHLSGWPDRMPSPPYGAYTDYINPMISAAILVAALDYRHRTGIGMYIDHSQLETSLHYIAPVIMDYLVNKRIMNRDGNRLPYAAPHGVYQCKGEDRWCAISIFSDDQWNTFCKVVGKPEWRGMPEFATILERKKNEDLLDRLIQEWTIKYVPEQVEYMLQAAGVPCHTVLTTKELYEDVQLRHRNHYQPLEHAAMGVHNYESLAHRLSKTPFELKPGPCLGQHNEYVFKEIIGLSEDEIADLLIEGVITNDAQLPDMRVLQ